VNQSITKLREQIQRGIKTNLSFSLISILFALDKITNIKTQQRNEKRRLRIPTVEKKIAEIKAVLNSSNDEIRKKNDLRIEHENKLHVIRRQRLNEVYKYIFPIEHVSSIEE
jgi:hypothetical protein